MDQVEAHVTGLLVDPDAPGLTRKLVRASVRAAKARGATVAYLRAGLGERGEALGAMYRGMGAEGAGALWAKGLIRG